MGEITAEMETSKGGRPSETSTTSGTSSGKTKFERIHDMGLTKNRVSRMEKIAAHPDIVDEVIAESQAGMTDATQALFTMRGC